MCDPNHTWIIIKNATSPWKITHVNRFGVAPGTSIKTKWSASVAGTIKAGITAYGEGSVSGNIVIGKAEAKVGYNLAVEGSITTSKTISTEVNFSSAKVKRVYALSRGQRRYNGGFEKWRCWSNGKGKTKVKYGQWRSFRPGVAAVDTTLCKRGGTWLSYPAGSLDAKACSAIR